MKTTRLFLAALLTIACFISSCKKDDDNNNNTACTDGSGNFAFLALNRSVTYEFEFLFFDTDTATYNLSQDMGGGKWKIATDSKRNNESGFFPATQYWQACDKDFYADQITEPTNNHWWVSLNSNVGDTWSRTLNGVTSSYELLSKTETVAVPEGTYTNCMKITYNQAGTFNTDTFYFHPDVSIVKYDGFMVSYMLIDKNF